MNRIKELRKERKMSQMSLSIAANVHQTAVSQWETGKTNPDLDTLKRLADLFGVSVDYILYRTDEVNPTAQPHMPSTGLDVSDEVRELSGEYARLSDKDRSLVKNLIQTLSEKSP
ncbi:MAG: helix-turn-helix domain-containing protein [Oscillospiraceae bacterium]|jgi:transcriptional regulator with XRE-family HTH domain|nr:helix-turn-helix domain-containing protein [Oscillospiraceae bacterium]